MGLRRRLAATVAVAVGAALISTGSGASAQQGPPNPPPFDHVGGGNVVPPGNTGHIPATALPQALAGSYDNPNITDQRDLFVEWKRKDWSFVNRELRVPEGDPKAELGEPYSPRDGVTIYRDGWGVPRIFAKTDVDAQFGVGYAMAEDRLFQADIFRHVARGEMAEFIGGQGWYDYDRAWRAEFYTDDELLAMHERFFTPKERELLQAYADGINAYIEEALTDPNKLPAEYVALGLVPTEWEVTDSLSVAVLQARDSVEGFGEELFNAALLADLRDRLGAKEGAEVFSDLRFIRDPAAYTTAPRSEGRFPYPGGGFEGLAAPGIALPDDLSQVDSVLARDRSLLQGLEAVGLARRQASNAIAVSSKQARGGDAILLGGPQLHYLVPGIFWEFEVHAPSQHARGIGFAGTVGVVLIGKSPTHAWSITYGYTDQIDTFLVPLDPEDPSRYMRNGKSKELQTYTTTVRCKADQVGLISPAESDLCEGLPAHQTELEVTRVPEYGPIIGTVDVDGKPHAVVKVRTHWMREVQNAKPFLTFNSPTTIDKFRAAQRDYNVSLNINYADDKGNAGFWHVARPPIRARGTDVRLPTLGNGKYDWTGFVPLEDIPHAINPRQGYTANWNNQISSGWHNGDQNYWGDLQRVDMLARRMKRLAAGGEITPDEVWRVNREAALEDGRWFEYMPVLRRALRAAPLRESLEKKAWKIVQAWDGQRASSPDAEGVYRYDDPAVAIFDRWIVALQQQVMENELGEDFYARIGSEFAPAFYHLKSTVLLRILEGRRAALPARHDWTDGKPVPIVVRAALESAVTSLAEEFGDDPSAWHTRAVMTTYTAVGLGRVKPHPFLNRGTYNELAVIDNTRR